MRYTRHIWLRRFRKLPLNAVLLACMLLVGEARAAKVLFSGHSLLDNPLPDWVEMIAQSKGRRLAWEEQIVIGSPVRVRTWGDGDWRGYGYGKNRNGEGLNIARELSHPKSGDAYDALGLAEGHTLLGMILWENAIGYLRHFHDRLLEGNPSGRTFYYHSWLGLDKRDPEPWLRHEENAAGVWQCVAEKVRLSLEEEGKQANITILPAGTALTELVRRVKGGQVKALHGSLAQQLDMIFRDDVHLTDIGIYYVAAVSYASIFKESPQGAAAPSSIAPALAEELQVLAWEYAQDYEQREAHSRPSMASCRQILVNKACPSYWSLKKEPSEIGKCSYFADTRPGSGNPFVWPDPDWQALAAPGRD